MNNSNCNIYFVFLRTEYCFNYSTRGLFPCSCFVCRWACWETLIPDTDFTYLLIRKSAIWAETVEPLSRAWSPSWTIGFTSFVVLACQLLLIWNHVHFVHMYISLPILWLPASIPFLLMEKSHRHWRNWSRAKSLEPFLCDRKFFVHQVGSLYWSLQDQF